MKDTHTFVLTLGEFIRAKNNGQLNCHLLKDCETGRNLLNY